MTALELMISNLELLSFDELEILKSKINFITSGESINYEDLNTRSKSILQYEGIVPCIKFIKEFTGWGLLESKQYYDNNIK